MVCPHFVSHRVLISTVHSMTVVVTVVVVVRALGKQAEAEKYGRGGVLDSGVKFFVIWVLVFYILWLIFEF